MVDGDLVIVASLLGAFAISMEQQAVHLHYMVDALWVGRSQPRFR